MLIKENSKNEQAVIFSVKQSIFNHHHLFDPFPLLQVLDVPLNQRLTNVPTSAVIRDAVWMANVSASPVIVGRTAVSPPVPRTATTMGGA